MNFMKVLTEHRNLGASNAPNSTIPPPLPNYAVTRLRALRTKNEVLQKVRANVFSVAEGSVGD